MKTKEKKINLTLCYLFITVLTFGQSPIFNASHKSGQLLVNPAFAGANRCPVIGLNYLFQYNSPYRQYNTFAVSYDAKYDALSGGLGLIVLSDGDGKSFQHLSASGIYSYSLPVTREFTLKTALKMGYAQTKINCNSFSDRNDLSNNNTIVRINYNSNSAYFNSGAGIVGYSKRYFAAISADNINFSGNAENDLKLKMPLKLSAMAGAIIPLLKGNESFFNPLLIYEGQKSRFPIDSIGRNFFGGSRYIALNFNYNLRKFYAGLGYRYMFNTSFYYQVNAGIDLEGFQLRYYMGLSPYKNDQGINKTAMYHQLCVDYRIPCKPHRKIFRTVGVPTF